MIVDMKTDPLHLDAISSDAEIGAALRPLLATIQRDIAANREKWAMVQLLHGEESEV